VSATTAAPEESPKATETPKTPEQIERYWFENVYAGDRMRQLTARALIMGMLLGMIMACSNVYVGLKSGWAVGVAITSCIMAWAIFAALHATLPKLFPRRPRERSRGRDWSMRSRRS
jgi:hypothetical protein